MASKRPRLKPYYSVTELAQMAGCCRATMYNRLKKRGYEFKGGAIPLSDIKIILLDLWESREIARRFSLEQED